MGRLIKTKNNDIKEKLIVNDKKYSHGLGTPIYEPKNRKPKTDELYSLQQYSKLVQEIGKAKDVTDREREFLLFAASRHIVFNYSLIADYYAHASKTMQRLMEQSALVIVDVDSAIENGYVQLSQRMEELRNEAKKAT